MNSPIKKPGACLQKLMWLLSGFSHFFTDDTITIGRANNGDAYALVGWLLK
jgi:hypothetical protein